VLILLQITFRIRALTKPASLVRIKKSPAANSRFFYNFMWLAPQWHCAVQQNDKQQPAHLQEGKSMEISIHREGNNQ